MCRIGQPRPERGLFWVAAGRLLAAPKPVTMPVPGHPTAVVGTPDGRWALASLSTGTGGEIAVIALGREAPRLVRTAKLPGPLAAAFGMAIPMTGCCLWLLATRQRAC